MQGVWDQPVALQSGPLDMHSKRGDALLHEGRFSFLYKLPSLAEAREQLKM